MFWLVGWIFFGFFVGLIARALIPGDQPMGCIGTMFLGIGGSFVGGLIGFLVVGGSPIQFSGWIGSVLGAVLLLFLQRRKHLRVLAEDPSSTRKIWDV